MARLLFSRLLVYFVFIFLCVCAFSAEENFLLINGATDEIMLEFGPHIDERLTPACTFNIALSLMGYDADILKDEQTPTWDFQEGYPDYIESWKASQTPLSWMQHSCLWYSRLLASQLGMEKMQTYLASLAYGNQDLSGGLTKAWLSSSLKISPREQVDFIHKVIHGKLSISTNAIEMTKVLLFKEELPEGWKLYGKTGMGTIFEQNGENVEVVWFVGWIEKDHTFFPFAYNIRERQIIPGQSIPRVKQLLMESKVMSERIEFVFTMEL